jgi:DNA-binding transcriptional regulator YbjK
MLQRHEIEGLRRSAAMAPLAPAAVSQLIECCEQMAREREQIAAVLDRLPTSWASVRDALNRLHTILSE